MSNVPIAVGWKVIVKPRKGKTESETGIDLSATVEAQEHLVYLGTLIEVGEAAFKTKTAGGLDMSTWKVRPQVGDHVIFAPYGGLRIRQRGEKQPLILMNDTDIMGIVDDLDAYYSWIDI
jgi:co-chaperonin GroES (HSP10)